HKPAARRQPDLACRVPERPGTQPPIARVQILPRTRPGLRPGRVRFSSVAACNPELMDVEACALASGFRLAQRRLHGELWWWQALAHPEDVFAAEEHAARNPGGGVAVQGQLVNES